MVSSRSLSMILISVTLCTSVGCAGSQRMASCKKSYRKIFEINRALETEVANLEAHNAKTSGELRQAEEELAQLDSRLRVAQQKLANYEGERGSLYRRFGGGHLPVGVGDQLADLASRYPSLHYDPESGVAKLDTDVLFQTAETDIDSGARDMLKEFASILQSPHASDLKLMVVGHTDDRRISGVDARDDYPNNWHLSAGRALRVADYLQAHGVQESRMGVAGYGRYQPVAANDTELNRQRNRRVEVFLIAPDVPVVGWTETLTTVYR